MYYFAYATNLNKQQIALISPQIRPLYTATLHNYRLVFTGWTRQWRGGTATIKRSDRDKVFGAIYDVPEEDWRKLDRAENCPGEYERIRVIVNNEDGDATEAVTYIKKDLVRAEESKPSPEYLALIQQGYKDWRLV
ncbi:MAG: gamma-glutamylcyclotransferase family protein [Dehalococcoidales bacterium]